MSVVGILLWMVLGSAWVAHAEEFPPGGASEAEFKKGFDEDQGLTAADKKSADDDRLKLGGTAWSEFQYSRLSGSVSTNDYLLNPHSLWLYLDARLRGDVRGVVKFKAIYDPTVTDGAVSPLTGQSSRKLSTDLEEFKLLFSLKKTVFFTVGKQKIKWGSGKFWNPTDFLNTQSRNFLYTTDLRSGVAQVKTHVPVGASNFYLIQGLDGAGDVSKIRHSARAEVPVGPTETALSLSYQKGSRPVFGADLSAAVWDFDVYGEVSYSAGDARTRYSALGAAVQAPRAEVNGVLGLSYEFSYLNTDTITLAAEVFRNAQGYTRTADYTYVLAAGAYRPFYLSQQYGMLMVLVPKPGSWNRVTFTLYNLVNLTDWSAMSRLSTLITAMDDLSFDVSVGGHYGNGNGEFKIGGQMLDVLARLMIEF